MNYPCQEAPAEVVVNDDDEEEEEEDTQRRQSHSIRRMSETTAGTTPTPTTTTTTTGSTSQGTTCTGSRPMIVVGYAFGPKKLSTMGVVLAEASKAKIHRATTITTTGTTRSTTRSTFTPTTNEMDRDCNHVKSNNKDTHKDNHNLVFSLDAGGYYKYQEEESDHQQEELPVAVQVEDRDMISNNNNDNNKNNNNSNVNVDRVVRYFRSSCCSSVAETASTASSTTNNSTHNSSCILHLSPSPPLLLPIHLAFVPIDPDQPIADQHGGAKIHVILHKLTEDILCLAQMSSSSTSLSNTETHPQHQQQQQAAAVRRIRNLYTFSKQQGCCLLDDPMCIQTLMQRDTMSARLSQCLQGLSSTSGVPVSTPKWTVVTSTGITAQEQIAAAGLQYPLIVKPLIAAGTSASHAMAVVLDPSGFDCLHPQQHPQPQQQTSANTTTTMPRSFLCQEYSNHDEILYKVYVLGSHVSVHKRRSLPNLPTTTTKQQQQQQCNSDDDHAPKIMKSVVEFDSQRPYPILSDFFLPTTTTITTNATVDDDDDDNNNDNNNNNIGSNDTTATARTSSSRKRPRKQDDCIIMDDRDTTAHENDENQNKKSESLSLSFSSSRDSPPTATTSTTTTPFHLTAEEIAPVVEAIKSAFGLNLFGFDVLVGTRTTTTTTTNHHYHRHHHYPTDTEERQEVSTANATTTHNNHYNPAAASTTTTSRSLLVVDVNYFPSYKEVSNFPSLLAQYLTERVMMEEEEEEEIVVHERETDHDQLDYQQQELVHSRFRQDFTLNNNDCRYEQVLQQQQDEKEEPLVRQPQ